MKNVELIATCAAGLEAVVGRELQNLGYTDQTIDNGKVTFRAGLEDIPKANLWLRSAGRVLVKMGSFKATSFEELFEKTKALPWADWLPINAEFPVNGRSIKSQLFSVPDCQAIVKKAVVEAMKARYRKQWFDENGPKFSIEVALLKDEATLTIDTSGAGLHRRGYRELMGSSPLRETLAAAMIQLSYWRPDRTLVDPCCGTGTIPIEAALIAKNIAPGLNRQFPSESWPVIPVEMWADARDDAQSKIITEEQELRIYGSDIDGEVLSLARHHARKAGVTDAIHFQKLPLADFRSRFKYGCIVTNPPYGERSGELRDVEKLYREMGETFAPLDTWSIYVITTHPHFENLYGKKADRRRKLYNGRLQATYFQYYGPPPPAHAPLEDKE